MPKSYTFRNFGGKYLPTTREDFTKKLLFQAATIFYALAFIVLLAGFGFCSGNARCDTRIAAGVSP